MEIHATPILEKIKDLFALFSISIHFRHPMRNEMQYLYHEYKDTIDGGAQISRDEDKNYLLTLVNTSG